MGPSYDGSKFAMGISPKNWPVHYVIDVSFLGV